MKLYFSPGACSLSPHIVLREAGAKFELEQVNNQEKKTKSGIDYWTVNGKGQVPVLEFDNGERLTEGPVIVQWIADQNPGAGLIPPAGKPERYRVQEWLNFVTSELHKVFAPLFRPTTPDAFKDISKENLGKRFVWLDQQLAGKQYLMGDKFTGGGCVPVHRAALVRPREDRSRTLQEHRRLHGPRAGAAQGAGGDEGRRADSVALQRLERALRLSRWSLCLIEAVG